MNDKPQRRRFRFSLRTLLVFVTIACVGFGWLGVKVRAKQRERDAIKAIQELRGDAVYGYQLDSKNRYFPDATPPGSEWIRKLLGDDFFANVDGVFFFKEARPTDSDLCHLREFPKLRWVDLSGTRIGDAGLVYVAGLTQLKGLALNNSTVTDSGLAHLHGLTQLEELELIGTQVTDKGIESLQKALPNLEIIR